MADHLVVRGQWTEGMGGGTHSKGEAKSLEVAKVH